MSKFAASLGPASRAVASFIAVYGEKERRRRSPCEKNVRREFHPNLHEHRIWVPELKKFVRIRVTARGLKTINKNGAYRALKKAGVVAG